MSPKRAKKRCVFITFPIKSKFCVDFRVLLTPRHFQPQLLAKAMRLRPKDPRQRSKVGRKQKNRKFIEFLADIAVEKPAKKSVSFAASVPEVRYWPISFSFQDSVSTGKSKTANCTSDSAHCDSLACHHVACEQTLQLLLCRFFRNKSVCLA
jgi:hypothetical protein